MPGSTRLGVIVNSTCCASSHKPAYDTIESRYPAATATVAASQLEGSIYQCAGGAQAAAQGCTTCTAPLTGLGSGFVYVGGSSLNK